MKKTGLAAVGAGILLCLTLPALANPIVVGQPASSGQGNCFPFGCAYNGEYQQVYDHGQYSGPVTITGLEFFNTQADQNTTAMNSGTWTIALSTTAADWNTLSGTFANNIGSNNTTVFSGNLAQAWAFGDTLSIVFATPFTYDPANGNLLMDVMSSGVSAPGGSIYFDWTNSSSVMGRVYNSGTVETDGLVTGFVTNATSVPEPGSLGLFGAGLSLLALGGLFARMKRRQPRLA